RLQRRLPGAGGTDGCDRVLGADGDRSRTRRGESMNALEATLAAGLVGIATAIGCSSQAADPDSETHWLHVCDVDSDCGRGLSCVCNPCPGSCGPDDCSGLGASAACVTPTTSAVSAACESVPSSAICTRSCSADVDCTATEPALRCIGGACLVGSS